MVVMKDLWLRLKVVYMVCAEEKDLDWIRDRVDVAEDRDVGRD